VSPALKQPQLPFDVSPRQEKAGRDDLADGMFWDGLKLTTNAWVTVTFQWNGSGPMGAVPNPANVRAAPQPDAPIVGLAARFAHVRIDCHIGDWYRIAPDMWISTTEVTTATGVPACVTPR